MNIVYVMLLSIILFTIGLYGIITSKVGMRMIISLEILINAALLNVIGISSLYYSTDLL